MLSSKVFICIALGLVIFVSTIDARCKSCSTTSFAACINETAFDICFNGLDRSNIIGVCSEDKVCTEEQGICKPRASTRPTCGLCNTCVKGFACISQTEFELCDSQAVTGGNPVGITEECPNGQYCSTLEIVRSGNICQSTCLADAEPTCFAAKKESPTPAPGPEYTNICTGKSMGYYENTYDATCTTYVYCEELGGVMISLLYTCGSGFFSASLRRCTEAKPSRCL